MTSSVIPSEVEESRCVNVKVAQRDVSAFARHDDRTHTDRDLPAAVNKNFTFRRAREIVTYLHHLGISDAYASPYFQAGAESLHGYDITDHNKFNAAIGSREDYRCMGRRAAAHGMGQIADFVPNHMGINDPQNVWWQDVLENGPSSLYAPYFDIDWRPLKADCTIRCCSRFWGINMAASSSEASSGCVSMAARFAHLFDHVFPIAPGTYRYILELALENLAEFAKKIFMRNSEHSDRARISAPTDRDRPRANQGTRP